MKVLLDRSVLSAARVFEQCSREVSDPITRKPMRNRLAGLVATKCRQNVKTERGPIAAMAFRAASGELSLLVSYFSFEEGFRIAKYPDLPTYVDIFSGVGLSKFDWAISLPEQRGLLPIHLRNQPGNPTEQAAAFKRELGRLANPKDMESCVQNAIKKGSSESDIKHLKELATLLRKFGKKTPHIVDVLQLWTAHVVGIPYFATLDKNLSSS